MKLVKKPVIVNGDPYKPGMEDGFVYDIPMFGLFTKEECIKSGFTPDFENDKIPYIQTLEGKLLISKCDWILIGVEGERYPVKPNIIIKTYDIVEGQSEEDNKKFLNILKA